jgi:hypothetical protein
MAVMTTIRQIRKLRHECEEDARTLNEMLKSLAQRVSPYYDDDPLSLVGILDEYGLDTALLCTKAAVWNPKESRLFALACAIELRSDKHPWFDKTLNLMNRYARGDLHASDAMFAHCRAIAIAERSAYQGDNYGITRAAMYVTLPDAGEAALSTARLLQSVMAGDAKDERQQQEMLAAANEVIEGHFRKFFGYPKLNKVQ